MTTPPTPVMYGSLLPDDKLRFTSDLARFLGGDTGSFTGQLLALLEKADPVNLARLRIAFPLEAVAWGVWKAVDPAPTAQELADILRTLGEF